VIATLPFSWLKDLENPQVVIYLLWQLLMIDLRCDSSMIYSLFIFIGSLQGKVIWIIGASTGIGEYLAYEVF